MKRIKYPDGISGVALLFLLLWTLKFEPDPRRFGLYAFYICRYQDLLDKYLYAPVNFLTEFFMNITQSPIGGLLGFALGILIFGFLYGIIVGAVVRLILRLFKTPKVELKRDQVP
jgi:hypothetical protein